MSVALPVAAIAFGSVTPPQGDIVDLTVHLGCSTEISSFECTLQNWDKKYSDGGTYPIVEGSNAIIYVGRSPNCPLLLTGKVEETDPESRAIEHYLIVRGRCNGEQLFRRHVTKSWDNVKGEVVVKYVIDNFTSLSHNRGGIELIEDTDTTFSRLDYEDTPVFDVIKYIAETADLAGVIGYSFRIAPDGKFEFFPKNSKTSSVDLSERLEVGRHKRSIYRIKNKIVVKGAAERPEPIDRDQWTEPTQDPPENWVAVSADTTITRSAVNPKSGIYRVLAVKGTLGTLDFYRSISALNVEKGTSLKFWGIYGVIITGFSVRLRAPDASNYFERTMAVEQENIWRFYESPTGRGTEYDAVTNPNGAWIKVGSPSWSDVQGIEFLVTRPVGGFNLAVDGMFFDKFRWRAMREDAVSQTQYGVRERPPEVDEELHSDAECDYRAKALLDYLKGPLITPAVRSTVIDFGTTPILGGDKTHIILPNENVDADYPIISAEYKLNGENQTLDVDLELAKEPQLLADFIYGFRKSIQKLDKYKSGR
jgi:hypothetical protein